MTARHFDHQQLVEAESPKTSLEDMLTPRGERASTGRWTIWWAP
jgi:hypothetical protein